MSALREAARDQACVRCARKDGTVVLAHYSGPWQHRFGKGLGKKGHDVVGADLCAECHQEFDQYKRDGNTIRRSEEFLACCLLTVIRRMKQRVIEATGIAPPETDDKPCVRCGQRYDIVVTAPYAGAWLPSIGNHDVARADVCRGCLDELNPRARATGEIDTKLRSEEFLACCLLTVLRRIRHGVLKIND